MMQVVSLVTTEWLNDHLQDGMAVIDVRAPQFYTQGHIPGAVNLPSIFLTTPGGEPARVDRLAQRLGRVGITRDTPVVLYDDGASPAAAVGYWVLSYCRHPSVAVLDGGITKWRHEGRDWEYTPTQLPPAHYDIAEPDESAIAMLENVKRAVDGETGETTVLLDARSPAEFLGFEETARRNGHIPGAVNIEWSNNLTQGSDAVSVHRPPDELKQMYEEAGVSPDKEVIVYCHSGSRSAETYFVLTTLGYPRVRHYVGGWQEWGNRADTQVETG